MAGRTWKDLKQGSTNSSESKAPSGAIVKKAVAQQSPRLASLLEKRQALENRLQALTSGADEALDPRDAARFKVPTFAQRQAQQREWEAQREALQTRTLKIRRQARSMNSR